MRLPLVIHHHVPLMIVILVSLALLLVGPTFMGLRQLSLRVIPLARSCGACS